MAVKEGTWQNVKKPFMIMTVKGTEFSFANIAFLDFPDIIKPINRGNIEQGSFGPVKKELQELCGSSASYNLEMAFIGLPIAFNAFLDESGSRLTFWGLSSNSPETMILLTNEELQACLKSRESVLTPSCPHVKVQPENQGKIYWLSGPPGCGKSTTCQLLAKKKGFVYYEADCTMNFLNPFLDSDVENPTIAAFSQPPLKDLTEEDVETIQSGAELMKMLRMGNLQQIEEKSMPIGLTMARHIRIQKDRLGGHFAVAQATMTRNQRDKLKAKLGPELIFIVLSMSESCQKKRIEARHGTQKGESLIQAMKNLFNLYEAAGEDEENAFNVEIDEKMNENDVLDKVLEVVAKIGEIQIV